MREETQPWNNIRLGVEIVDNGTGQTGLTVTATLRRSSDNQFLQSAGGWGASPSNLTLTQASAANLPGLYLYAVAATDTLPTDGHYLAKITESTYAVLEYVRIIPALPAQDGRLIVDSQTRMRFIPSAWDSTTKQPTAGTIYLYASDALYDADTTPNGTGAYASQAIEATFSGAGELQKYGRSP